MLVDVVGYEESRRIEHERDSFGSYMDSSPTAGGAATHLLLKLADGAVVRTEIARDAFERHFGSDFGSDGAAEELVDVCAAEYDAAMPKVDAANRIKQFILNDKFQAEFDAWAADVEKEHGGKLEIVHQEVIQNDTKLVVSWRIAPKPHMTRLRR